MFDRRDRMISVGCEPNLISAGAPRPFILLPFSSRFDYEGSWSEDGPVFYA